MKDTPVKKTPTKATPRLDTSASAAIIAPTVLVADIERAFERKTANRLVPWNVIRLHARIDEALWSMPHLYRGVGRNNLVLLSIPRADAVPAEQWSELIKAVRGRRHYGMSYLFGFRSERAIPVMLRVLASVNLFKS
jgi:hypothetical protein